MKKYIYSALLSSLALSASLSSCADMLDPESDLVMYPEDNRLNTPNDTLYSVIGAIHLMQKVADRTNVLGEVRGDLVTLTEKASIDLQELASFQVGLDNAYNQPQDYYAIVNNCNYFIANADSTYKKQGVKVFERELAVMHTYRAWAYLQLCLNYGDIPFYTDFLGSQLEAEAVLRQPRKSVKEVCNWLIDDLQQWITTKPLVYQGSINGHSSDQYTIPVRVMLGDLCLWAERYQESAQYYHDYLTFIDDPHPVYYNSTEWAWAPGRDLPSDGNIASSSYTVSAITSIPMESSSFYGTISQLQNLYNSTEANSYYNEITYSQAAIEHSAAQAYYLEYVLDETMARDTLRIDKDSVLVNIVDPRYYGDLRLADAVSSRHNSLSDNNDKYNQDRITNKKHSAANEVVIYRLHPIYIRYAEALNRAGFPTAAFAVLKYGLSDETTKERAEGDPISADERAKAGTLLTFSPADFTRSNTMGIHSRGCGDATANPEYVIPVLPTANDTMLWVEDRVIDELALETVFEGQRYYDLIRIALRRNDPAYLADRVAAREGSAKVDAALRTKLMDKKNWYLPFN